MEECWPFGIVLWGTVSNRPMRRWLKTGRRERCGKVALDALGGGEGDDHCLRVESIEVTSEPGYSNGSGRSLAGAHVLARRCPAQRRRDPCLRLSQGTWEGERGYCSVVV